MKTHPVCACLQGKIKSLLADDDVKAAALGLGGQAAFDSLKTAILNMSLSAVIALCMLDILRSVQGKIRELQADDDAKAAALEWASQAAFGNTEVAAPKILGDVIESLVGAVYIDSGKHFEKTWEVRTSDSSCGLGL